VTIRNSTNVLLIQCRVSTILCKVHLEEDSENYPWLLPDAKVALISNVYGTVLLQQKIGGDPEHFNNHEPFLSQPRPIKPY
jgi:hypothetical protein